MGGSRMPITERTLKKWRREALRDEPEFTGERESYINIRKLLNQRILKLTQELLDQHLLRKAVR